MKCILRCTASLVVLTVVAAGATAVVLGKHRTMDLARSMREAAQSSADELIQDQKKIQQQLEELRASYPERIAKLRNAIRTEQSNIAHVERDQEVCLEVLALCQEDISDLQPQIESATISTKGAPVAINFRGRIYSVTEAQGLASRAVETHDAYTERYNSLASEREMINSEIAMLEAELKDLRAEQESFESEYRAVQRELDRIEHNKRLIELAAEREKLSDVRTLQEEQLRALRVGPSESSYEDRARVSLHLEDKAEDK